MRNWQMLGILAIALLPGVPASATVERVYDVEIVRNDQSEVPLLVRNIATSTADMILAQAGVRLRWMPERPAARLDPCDPLLAHRIRISVEPRAPRSVPRGVLASALPFSNKETRITIYFDRVRAFYPGSPASAGAFYGHVLAHEIIHVLQKVNRHADQGVMHQRWSPSELQQLVLLPLALTETDIKLIRAGLATVSPCAVY
jgi:hypothetical protein